jgi:hypothetical protein
MHILQCKGARRSASGNAIAWVLGAAFCAAIATGIKLLELYRT